MRVALAVARRVVVAAGTLLCITAIVFGLLQMAPGDAAGVASEGRVLPAHVEAMRAQYHLDEPPLRRYGLWLADVLRGDFGRSCPDRPARPYGNRGEDRPHRQG